MKVTKPSLNNGHTAMQKFICLGGTSYLRKPLVKDRIDERG